MSMIDHLRCVFTAGGAQAASRKAQTEGGSAAAGIHLSRCYLCAGCVALVEGCNAVLACSSPVDGALLEQQMHSEVHVPLNDAGRAQHAV
jgi:hypothetical protein